MADKLTIRLGSVLSGDVFVNCVQTRRPSSGPRWRYRGYGVHGGARFARRFDRGAYIIALSRMGRGTTVICSPRLAHNSALCVEELLNIIY